MNINGKTLNEFIAKHLVEDGVKLENQERLKLAEWIKDSHAYVSLEYDKEFIDFN